MSGHDKTWIEKKNFRKSIMDSILVSSMTKKDSSFPTISKFILSEMMNGTIMYAGGNAGKMRYQDFYFDERKFEREIWDYFIRETRRGKIDMEIKGALNKILKYRWESPTGPDRNYLHTDLYDDFRGPGCICDVYMESTFSPEVSYVKHIKNKFMPLLTEKQRKDVEGIGKASRKYIDEDVEYIRKTYHW